jgi:hypothetical protein
VVNEVIAGRLQGQASCLGPAPRPVLKGVWTDGNFSLLRAADEGRELGNLLAGHAGGHIMPIEEAASRSTKSAAMFHGLCRD